MQELTIFNFKEKQVRTITDEQGNPWFCLKDICEILELTTPSKVKERLDIEEVNSIHILDSNGKRQETTIVNESGLYNVILSSRGNTVTKPFKKWVTSEVLPSIRKTGSYSTNRPLLQEEVEAQKALAVEQIVMSATKLFKLDDVASVLYAQDRFYASKLPVPKNIPILKAVKKIFYRTDIYQLFPKSEKKQIKIILDKMQENKEYAQMNLFGKNGHIGTHYVFYENIIDLIKKELIYLN